MEENNWPSDLSIESYLNEKTDLPNQQWSQRRIKGLKEIDNPILDSNAEKIYQEYDQLRQNPTISILSSKGLAFDLNEVNETPNPYTPLKQSYFRSELFDGSCINKPINTHVDVSSLGAQFLNQPDSFKNLNIDSSLQSMKSNLSYQWKYLLIDVDDLTAPGNNIEPIVCSVFVLDNKKIVSERWKFFTQNSITFFECKLHSQHAAIDISALSDSAYLIVAYYRIFLVDGGDICNSYYKKPSDSLQQKAIPQINLSLQRLKGCYSPFAFSFIPLKSIIANNGGNIEFPNAYLLEKPLTAEYIPEMIEKVKKLSFLPIVLKLKSKVQKVPNLRDVDSNYLQIRSIQPDVNQPILEFRHQLIVTLGAAKFDQASKLNARNILAQVSFVDGGKPLPVIHDKWAGPGLCEVGYSRCLYHEKSPIYDDEFIIDLPINLSSQACIQINYYHIATQEKEQAMRQFASATLPINENDIFIKDGVTSIAINYPKTPAAKATPSNCQLIKTQLYSSINSPDDMLSPMFLKVKKIPAIEFADQSKLTNFLYQVLDSLIEGLNTNQPKASVKGLIHIGTLAKQIGPDQLSQIMNFYVNTFALRNKETQTTQIHNELFKFWLDFLNTKDATKNRKDIPVSSFLFTLILKSIIATNDRDFGESFNKFFDKVKELSSPLAQSNIDLALVFNKSLAIFTACLTDIGYYQLSSKIVTEYATSFGKTENDYLALTEFLDVALHPKLFIASSLAQDTFPTFFYKLISQALQVPNTSKMQSIYRILCRLFLFVPEKDQPEVASKYVNLLQLFSQYPIRLERENLRYFLCDAIFIFKYVKSFEFQTFYNNSETPTNLQKSSSNMSVNDEQELDFHQLFNKLIHFVLTKSRIPFKRSQSQIPDSQLEIVKESLRQMKKRNRQTIYQSNETLVPMTSPAVHDAYTNIARETDNLGDENDLQRANQPESRDLAVDAQLSVFNILNHILDLNNPDSPKLVLGIIYHYLSSNICIDVSRQIKEISIKFIEKNTKMLILSTDPPFVLFLTKLLSLLAMKNTAATLELVNILPRLFSAEKRQFPTNNRSLVSSVRAISKMKDEDIESPTLMKALEHCSDNGGIIDKIIECLKATIELNTEMKTIDEKHFSELRYKQVVGKATSNETNIEKYGEDMFTRSRILSASPDACAEEIGYLTQYHDKNDYLSESLMAQIYQVALIVEYLTVLKFIPNPYAQSGVDHPALIFHDMCNSVSDNIVPDFIIEDPPLIPGFCDSSMFSLSGIYMLIQAIHSYCKRSKLFEISNEVMRLTYPIFEQCDLYKQLANQFTIDANMSYQFIENMSSNMDRMLGRYYRVGFYGKVFGSDDGKMFVQREVKLTHLFDVTNRIKNTYIKLFGPDKIEILTESGTVDRALLDPEKGYIQLTFVEPYFEKKELQKRVTVFECSNKLSMFKFETPFVKGEKKLQGSVETQWQRRTILKVKTAMPSVIKRVEVPPEGYIVREYEPIRVSIRQIKERLVLYENAIAKNDAQAIQPLLHGSLLVQVNEGPTKMAEVFLGSPLRTKYTEKMRKLFQRFLDLNAQGLAIHGRFVAQNPGFQELQNQLEEGLKNLTMKLAPYLYPPNQK